MIYHDTIKNINDNFSDEELSSEELERMIDADMQRNIELECMREQHQDYLGILDQEGVEHIESERLRL